MEVLPAHQITSPGIKWRFSLPIRSHHRSQPQSTEKGKTKMENKEIMKQWVNLHLIILHWCLTKGEREWYVFDVFVFVSKMSIHYHKQHVLG